MPPISRAVCGRARFWPAVVLAALAWLCASPAVVAQQTEKFVVVPLLVNVLPGVTFGDDDIEAMVREANRILKQAKIRLDFDKKKHIQRNAMVPGTNNDDEVDAGETDKVKKWSADELASKFGKGRGYKLILANKLFGAATSVGLTSHSQDPAHTYYRPVPAAPTRLKGNDLAHEFAHAFTLGRTHLIDDKGDEEAANDIRAVNFHYPFDPNNPLPSVRNLMHALNPAGRTADGRVIPRGEELTEAQKAELQKTAKTRGQTKEVVVEGGVRAQSALVFLAGRSTRHGSWTDELEDVALTHIDLAAGSLFADGFGADWEVSIGLAGLHPAGTDVTSQIELFINADNNGATGGTFGSFTGIEKILRMNLSGQHPFTSPSGSFSATLFDVASATSSTLTPGRVDRIEAILESDDEATSPVVLDDTDAIIQTLPFGLLGSVADQVPIGVRATDVPSAAFDEASFVFVFNPPPGPSVDLSQLTGRSGSGLTVTGADFSPLSSIDLLVDDTVVATATTLADGSFATTVIVPPGVPGPNFVTARDPALGFDFSAVQHLGDALPAGDFDGDGRADVAVYRTADQHWFMALSSGGTRVVHWGAPGDLPVPADYDGDGVTDVAVFRPADGSWFIVRSTGGAIGLSWGTAGDLPVAADYDGDGSADVGVFRPADGGWYIIRSTGGAVGYRWGMAGDLPVPADYDGDGLADIAVYRPDESAWYVVQSRDGARALRWGERNDVPVVADFDGDGRADIGVFRGSEQTWFIVRTALGATAIGWGAEGDAPLLGDFDGDGQADVAVYRPAEGAWYIARSTGDALLVVWGEPGDMPL